ncbi:hypothetical protein [Streptomyces sp. NBC_01262]|uniref:hypothetical protein n=1 Tax=Streptomyces sp. NBC_01262 TaxID=2903803 RepID=UPI002E313FEF|nr:hypothetical protein [Streptomyces sp. NBC_01262]
MLHPGQRPGLAQYTLPQLPLALLGVLRRPHLLEGDLPVQHGVAGPPHQTHTPAAEPLQQLETPVDQFAVPALSHWTPSP